MNAFLPIDNHFSLINVLIAGLLPVAGFFIFRVYSGLKWKGAILLAVACTVVFVGPVVFMVTDDSRQMEQHMLRYRHERSMDEAMAKAILALPFALLCGTAILAKLYQKWISEILTDGERQPGGNGFRAWFRVGNLVLALLFAASTSIAFDLPFFSLLMLSLGVFALYPLIKTLSCAEASLESEPTNGPTAPPIDTNAERDRVLRMLEQEKISPDDGADLLKAIGQGPDRTSPPVPAPQQRFFLAGALLVVFGFLLPWIAIDPGKELSSAMRKFSAPGLPAMSEVVPTIKTGTHYIRGGDLEHGLGWIVLIAGLATPAIWLFARSLDLTTKKTISLLALGIGGILLLYILSSAFRHLSFGFPVVLVGYALLTVAVFRKTRPPRMALS